MAQETLSRILHTDMSTPVVSGRLPNLEAQQTEAKRAETEASLAVSALEEQKAKAETEARATQAQQRLQATEGAEGRRKTRDEPFLAQEKEYGEAMMKAHFEPSKENLMEQAALFSLINVIGFAIGGGGKQNAQAAMSAMNGMLEGHQKGRADLYKQELNKFDKNLKSLQQRATFVEKELAKSLQEYTRDKDAGLQRADAAFAQSQADFMKDYAAKAGLVKAYEYAKDVRRAADKAVADEQRHQDRVQERIDAEQRAAAQREFEAKQRLAERKEFAKYAAGFKSSDKPPTQLYTDPKTGQAYQWDAQKKTWVQAPGLPTGIEKVGGGRKGSAQDTAIGVLQQDVLNANYNLKDLKDLASPTGKLPGGSVAFAQKFTGDITSMLMRYAANSNIDEGLQGMDALMLNLAFDIASAQSGGRGQLSDTKVRAVVSQMPLDEQPEYTKATKWAALLERVDNANKTLPDDKKIEIPADVRSYYSKGRAGVSSSSSSPKEGDKSKSKSGKPMVFRNGEWHYE